jgi:hypothetical protein
MMTLEHLQPGNPGSDSVARALQQRLLMARNNDGGWGYEPERTSRLEPTCWALLALQESGGSSDRVLAEWPSCDGALVEHRGGLSNWSFHALALLTRLALGDAPIGQLQRLANALVETRGIALKPSAVQRQDGRLQGWSWIQRTFSWAEPTAWAVLALKKCRARGIVTTGADTRIGDGEAVLRDRVCVAGGWNYGNSNAFEKDLPAYVPTTAIALLALQDRGDEAFVRRSLNYLEEHVTSHLSTRALALSTLALRRYGRSTSLVESALRTWLTSHPPTDVATIGMAVCALDKSAVDEEFAC